MAASPGAGAEVPAGRTVRRAAYVVAAFPQLSETFVENERAAMEEMGVAILMCSLYRPRPDLAGPTTAPEGSVRYRPAAAAVARHFARWAVRRPGVTARNLARALAARSQTMLKGAVWAGWLASEVEAFGARHVHGHFGSDGASAAVPAARLAGVPVTFTVHAREIYVRNRALDVRVRSADRAVTVCEYNVEQIRERFPSLGRDDFDIVYCGVDPGSFPCVDRSAHGGQLIISVGRLVEKKGFDLLIRAVARMRAAGSDVRCEIIGHGPLAADLDSLAASLGVADAVSLPGARPPSDVAARLADADVFALPCRVDADGDRDSMPVVLKEAMATCLPVVATAVVGIPELVDDAVGRLVPAEDVEALARALEEVLELPGERRAELGRAARRRVEERFDIRAETARLAQLFERLAPVAGRNRG